MQVEKTSTDSITCRRLRKSGESPYGEFVSCSNCCWFCCAMAVAVASAACWPVARLPGSPPKPPIPVWPAPAGPPKPKSTSRQILYISIQLYTAGYIYVCIYVLFTCRWAWPARWPILRFLGFWGSKVPQNVRFPALDAVEPPSKMWRR